MVLSEIVQEKAKRKIEKPFADVNRFLFIYHSSLAALPLPPLA